MLTRLRRKKQSTQPTYGTFRVTGIGLFGSTVQRISPENGSAGAVRLAAAIAEEDRKRHARSGTSHVMAGCR